MKHEIECSTGVEHSYQNAPAKPKTERGGHEHFDKEMPVPQIPLPTQEQPEGEAAGKEGQPEGGGEKKGKAPDFRIVQPGVGLDGRTNYENVGAMWHNVSKAGADFYSLKIGNLKLLVFPNILQRMPPQKFEKRSERFPNKARG